MKGAKLLVQRKHQTESKSMRGTKLLVWIVVALTVITIAFVWIVHELHDFSEPNSKDALVIESTKTLLQLAGVAALGGWLKFLYDEVTQQRRRAEKTREQEITSQNAANAIRKGLLDDLITARSRVEEARIKYRIEESINPLDQYRATVLAILDARLNLSRIWNAIETSNYLFCSPHRINSHINKMKLYLDELIKEYESQIQELRVLPKDGLITHLRDLKVFGDFVLNAESSDYGSRFLVTAYRPAVSEIRREVLRAREISIEEMAEDGFVDLTQEKKEQ